MKSPFTGKEMKQVRQQRMWKFRGEEFPYNHIAYLCEDTGELFTTDETDDQGYEQVTKQYRAKYGIPGVEEIQALRRKYNLSAAKMSLILGFGPNQYRLYEQGEVPSISNGRLIRCAENPETFRTLINCAKNQLKASDYLRILQKIRK